MVSLSKSRGSRKQLTLTDPCLPPAGAAGAGGGSHRGRSAMLADAELTVCVLLLIPFASLRAGAIGAGGGGHRAHRGRGAAAAAAARLRGSCAGKLWTLFTALCRLLKHDSMGRASMKRRTKLWMQFPVKWDTRLEVSHSEKRRRRTWRRGRRWAATRCRAAPSSPSSTPRRRSTARPSQPTAAALSVRSMSQQSND